ncbi:MAG TPA: hypothetical protein VHM19_12445 [Polyangiales bacterium]|jgi:hypothetical protein|nr:hypothetical protein [Polyangiales bacterium]
MQKKTLRNILGLAGLGALLLGSTAAWAAPTTWVLSPVAGFNITRTDFGPGTHFVRANATYGVSVATINPIANTGNFVSKITLNCAGTPFTSTSPVVASFADPRSQLLVLCPFGLPLGTSAVASLDSL